MIVRVFGFWDKKRLTGAEIMIHRPGCMMGLQPSAHTLRVPDYEATDYLPAIFRTPPGSVRARRANRSG